MGGSRGQAQAFCRGKAGCLGHAEPVCCSFLATAGSRATASCMLAPGRWVLRPSRELGLEAWGMKRQQLGRGEAFCNLI